MVDSSNTAVTPPVESEPLVSWEALGALSDQAPYLRLWSVLHLIYAAAIGSLGLLFLLTQGRWHVVLLILIPLGALPVIAYGTQGYLELSAASAMARPTASSTDQATPTPDIELGVQRLARLWRFYIAMSIFSVISGAVTSVLWAMA